MGILTAPVATRVEAGKTATYSCHVTKNTNFVPTVAWFKAEKDALKAEENKRKITTTEKTDSTLSVLELLKIQIADKGYQLTIFHNFLISLSSQMCMKNFA